MYKKQTQKTDMFDFICVLCLGIQNNIIITKYMLYINMEHLLWLPGCLDV